MEKSTALRAGTGRLFVGLMYAVAFTLPLLRPQWHGILTGLLAVCWFFTEGPSYLKNNWRSSGMLLVFTAIFFLDAAGLLYSENLPYGKAYLETELPLLIFPLIIFSSGTLLTPAVVRNCCIAFAAGVITLNLASLAFISWDLWDPQRLEANVIIASNSIVRIHPVFLSVFISFAFFFVTGTYFPLGKLSRSQLGWVLFSSSVLLVYLLWMNSRVGWAGFLTAALFYASSAGQRQMRPYAFGGIFIIVVLLFSMPFSRERFLDAPLSVLHPQQKTSLQDYNTRTLYFRSEIYGCSWEIIKGKQFFYGFGTGDFKDELLKCYAKKNFQTLLDKKLDAHSEYFAQLHRTGVAGLVFFIGLLVIPFYFALRYKSPLYGSFLILFAVTALFETILSSQKGVTFFSMFSVLLFIGARAHHEATGKSGPPLNTIS